MTPGRNTDLGSATVTPRRSGKWGMLLIIIVRGSLGYNHHHHHHRCCCHHHCPDIIGCQSMQSTIIDITSIAMTTLNQHDDTKDSHQGYGTEQGQFENDIMKWFPRLSVIFKYTNIQFSESSISACHFFDHVSGPLKLKLLRGLWPFSFGRQTSWCDWRWSGDVESAEPSDSSLESESDVRSANLSFKTNSILMEERMLQFTFPLQQRQRQSCSDPSCRRSLRRRQGSSRREPSPWCYPRLSNRRSPGHERSQKRQRQ